MGGGHSTPMARTQKSFLRRFFSKKRLLNLTLLASTLRVGGEDDAAGGAAAQALAGVDGLIMR